MIPKVMPPLAELTVLVTRPAAQAAALCERMQQHGALASLQRSHGPCGHPGQPLRRQCRAVPA